MADLFEDGLIDCLSKSSNDIGAQIFCGGALFLTAGTRYTQDLQKLTAIYRRPYDKWQSRVQAENSG